MRGGGEDPHLRRFLQVHALSLSLSIPRLRARVVVVVAGAAHSFPLCLVLFLG